MTPPSAANVSGLEDAFIKVSFEEEQANASAPDKLYEPWIDNASGKRSAPEIFGADALRKLYPGHSLVMSSDYSLNLLAFPGAVTVALYPDQLITNIIYIPLARRLSETPGVLLDSIEFGCFRVAWDKFEFTVYIAKWPVGFGEKVQHFILHDGPDEPARKLLFSAGAWNQGLHDEIWVYDQGFWRKDHNLWSEVQKARWEDVILKEEFKERMKKDVYSFFTSEAIYKQLSIPWKRGLILYGPPGNGKTISLKTIMKTTQAQGHVPLYVKSFQKYSGEESAMADVFNKARQVAPCLVILEDLDSLINDRNRSFFLNQLDGLEGNDGLLVIGTTNHFERLDPGLSTRPSRFDRKYLFDDPDRDERALYAKYWQNKLADNPDVSFSDALVAEVADSTGGFSFAFLKEAFVSTLVILASDENEADFKTLLRGQIKELKKQLEKTPASVFAVSRPIDHIPQSVSAPRPDKWEATRTVALAAASFGRSFVY